MVCHSNLPYYTSLLLQALLFLIWSQMQQKNTSNSFFISIVAKICKDNILYFLYSRIYFYFLSNPTCSRDYLYSLSQTMATRTRISKKDCKFSSKLCDRDNFLVLEKVLCLVLFGLKGSLKLGRPRAKAQKSRRY